MVPPLDLAVPETSDASDTRAYCLALALTTGAAASGAIRDSLYDADRRATGAAREVASVPAMRVNAAALIRVVG